MKNACVVGYGAIGPVHANGIEKAENVKLYGICDINKTRADKGANEHNCKAFYDFYEVLENEDIDSVHICTPHYLHKEMVISAAKAGKEIVLEKPVSIDLKSFNDIEKATYNTKICVMLQNRYNNSISELKRIVDEDKTIGSLVGGFAAMTWHRDKEYYLKDSWRGKWETEGGGLLINQAIHLIDLISYLAGDIKGVAGSISNKTLAGFIEVEDTADALFSLANGAKVCYYATNGYTSNLPMRLELQFENALFRYADNCLYKIDDNNLKIIAKDSMEYEGKKYWGDSHGFVINNFYNDGTYPTLSDSENAMKALFKFYESSKNNSKEMFL